MSNASSGVENVMEMPRSRARAAVLVASDRACQRLGDDDDDDDDDAGDARATERTSMGTIDEQREYEEGGKYRASPSAWRARATEEGESEEEEGYAATRATLDALRERDGRAEPPDAMDFEWFQARARESDGGSFLESASRGTYAEVETISGKGTPSAMGYSKVGAVSLAVGDISGNITVMRSANGDMEAAMAIVDKAHATRVTRVDWNLNGSRLISGSTNGIVKVWNVNHTSKSTLSITMQSTVDVVSEVMTVLFHPVQTDLAFIGLKSQQVLIMDSSIGQIIERVALKHIPTCLDSNTSGTVLFVGDSEGKINVLICEPRMRKTLSLNNAEREAAVENPLQKVIEERSATHTERMDALGTLRSGNSDDSGDEDSPTSSSLRMRLKNMLVSAKNVVPRPQIGEVKSGYKLRVLSIVHGPKDPHEVKRMRYCTYPESMGGAALLACYANGDIRVFHAEGTPFKEIQLFTTCRIASSTQNGMGVISFAPGQMLELPLVSASHGGNRSAIYLLPSTPGAPAQVTQFTDNFDADSESAIDVAVVSVWSHEGSYLAIGYSSGKISIWRRP